MLVGCDPEKVAKLKALRFRVRRPEDLLVLDLELINFVRAGDQLERDDGDEDAFIVVHFPPQHILEEVVPEADADDPPAPPLESLLSGPSRVAFKLPADVDAIPYDLASLLDAIREYELAVHENAAPRAGVPLPPEPDEEPEPEPEPDPTPFTPGGLILKAQTEQNAKVTQRLAPALMPQLELDLTAPEPRKPAEPGPFETAIELPTRLLISPSRFTRFLHESEPVESSRGRVELWHTRLAALTAQGTVDEHAAALRTVRALWVRGQPFDPDDPSLDPSSADPPWDAPLTSAQRNKIVHQSSNWTQEGVESGDTEPAEPIDVDRLMLSALGGYLDSRAEWSEKTDNNLVGWEHRATLGRDHYVKVVELGYLFPFGNRAALVTISERRFSTVPPQTAFLYKRAFLAIKEPVRRYVPEQAGSSVRRTLRQMPFSSIEFRQLVTPNLDLPDAQEPFVPMLDGRTYRFPVHLLDRAGKLVTADVAAVWVPGSPLQTWATHADAARELLEGGDGSHTRGYTPLLGQRVALAPSGGQSVDENTAFEAASVLFDADDVPDDELEDSGLGLPFLPRITEAELAVEAVRAFAGVDDVTTFRFAERYVDHGFDAAQNPGELLLELAGGAGVGVDFAMQSDKSGGFLAPSMQMTGLSRAQGAVSGSLDRVADGEFDPEEFFADALPKLFGVIPLTDILQLGSGLSAAPKFITEVRDEVQAFLADLDRLQAQLDAVKDEAAALASDVDDVLEQVGEVVTALGEGAIGPDAIEPGGLLDGLREALQELDQAIAGAPGVPPGTRRFAREAIARVLEVLDVADKLLTAIERFQQAQELIQNRTVRLEFRPRIKADPLHIFVPEREDGLVLAAEIRAKASGSKPAGADLICSLENFRIQLIGDDPVFAVDFERMQFITRAGKKPDVDVVLSGLTFGGPLRFVERIKDIIPLDGFSDPPALDVGLDGITASFSLPLPNVAVGVFALENISISAGFRIPFLGDAITLNFGFCSRENPFSLTVAMLGGGGFVGLEIAPDGIRLLEIALEFGASLAVDFCVASGGVEIKAGLYLGIEGEDVTLCGYLRFRGHVQVLGIIGASIELAMELTYQSATGKVIGRASLRIEVTLLCFTVGVTLEVERKFAGSNADPTFAEVFQPLEPPALPTEGMDVPDTPWARYVNAFAL